MNATWTGQGPITRSVFNDHFKTAGFSENDHFNGTDRAADLSRRDFFTGADFTGATFRNCDLRQVKITGSWLVDVRMSGPVGNVVVNDVDVTAFVEAAGRPRGCRAATAPAPAVPGHAAPSTAS